MIIGEPGRDGKYPLVISNDSLADEQVQYHVWDANSHATVAEGTFKSPANQNWQVDRLKFDSNMQQMLLFEWQVRDNTFGNHYLQGKAPFGLEDYRRWLVQIAQLPVNFNIEDVTR